MPSYFSKTYKLPTLEEQADIINKIRDNVAIIKAKDDLQRTFIRLYNPFHSHAGFNELMTNYTIYREAKNSSSIENIVTKQDTMYKEFVAHNYGSEELKIRKASEALTQAFELFKQEDYIMSIGLLVDIQAILISNENEQGIRTSSVTIGSDENSRLFYRPPHYDDLQYLLEDWLAFFNKESDDPFVDMAIMHYQFESIHPFLDGNGRIGRILCYLYLLKNNIISYPIIGISNYILENREAYYNVLQAIKIAEINADKGQQEQAWVNLSLFFVNTLLVAISTERNFLEQFRLFIQDFNTKLEELSFFKKHSDTLSTTLLTYPYTTVEYFKTSLGISEPTALKYLKELTTKNIVKLEVDKGRNFYLNQELFDLLNQY